MSIAKLSRVMMAGLMLFATAANSQTAQQNAADAALVDRVKDAVAKELREADARAATMRPVSSRDHIRGNPRAPVTVVDYSDFECPFCKRFHLTMTKVADQ